MWAERYISLYQREEVERLFLTMTSININFFKSSFPKYPQQK
jgi:hypothetical protein